MKHILAFITLLVGTITALPAQQIATKTTLKPQIDGRWEDVWSAGKVESAFTQIDPDIFAEPTVRTEFYFLYDEETVYLAARLYQPQRTLKSSQARRDAEIVTDGDCVVFSLDPLNSGNSAYFFAVNASNAIADGILDRDGNWDTRWDGSFNSAVSIAADHWTIELEIPLTSIGYQHVSSQDWGYMVFRTFAQKREKIINNLVDKNQPFRVQDFQKMSGLHGLKKKGSVLLTPYFYSSHESNALSQTSEYKPKVGADIKVHPLSSIIVLATVTPDYAQLESDREIINVTDLPTEYPEKRPFFRESSDLYPGLAVNTRNIVDIKVGLKARQVFSTLKYDVTAVLDGNDDRWYLGNIRWTDNEAYHVEVISGMKDQSSHQDYNVTTNLRTWFFNKLLTAYTWFGTINSPRQDGNEYESVNSVKWISREINAGLWNHFKTQYYNPNIVGFNTLSNEIILDGWFDYSFIYESGFWRKIIPGVKMSYRDLYTNRGNDYLHIDATLSTTFNISETFGNWAFSITYQPETNHKFRYRKTQGYDETFIFEDAFSKFVVIDQTMASVIVTLKSDFSRDVGLNLEYNNTPVRQSKSSNLGAELYNKIGASSLISYSLSLIQIDGSPYQIPYRQTIHRLKVEYNITNRVNVRGIVQLNNARSDDLDDVVRVTPIINGTLSWEFVPGSFLYCVYNKFQSKERVNGGSLQRIADNQTFALKINHDFSF